MDTERDFPRPQPTGDSRVDDAIAGLAVLSDLPLDEHPPVLEAVHGRLREILGELGTVPPAGTTAPRDARGASAEGQWRQGQLGQQEHPRPAGPSGQQRR